MDVGNVKDAAEGGTRHASSRLENHEIDSGSSGLEADDNWELYKKVAGEETTAEEAKRVLWKIDRRLMPVLFVL